VIALVAGFVILLLVIQVLRWFAHADVKQARKAINWGGLGLIALVILVLAATGRIGAAIAGLLALTAWIGRIMSMLHMGKQLGGMFRSKGFGRGGGAAPQSSEVDSAFFKMRLDLSNGAMDGEVIRGRFAGRKLKDLDQASLMTLLGEVQSDADSVGLLEAYLDRAHPDWRDSHTDGDKNAAPPSSSAMTADEAHRILGVAPGASDADIKAAYRRLMGQLHPDHGGSDYLAAKVNQAKDLLLKK